jgi:hypothetical protein
MINIHYVRLKQLYTPLLFVIIFGIVIFVTNSLYIFHIERKSIALLESKSCVPVPIVFNEGLGRIGKFLPDDFQDIFRRVIEIDIPSEDIHEKDFEALKNFYFLKKLTLYGTCDINPRSPSPYGRENIFKTLGNIKSLRILIIRNTYISENTFKHIVSLENLQELDLDYSIIPTNELYYLREMPSLEVLSLNGTDIDDTAISHLKCLKQLNSIMLFSTNISEHGFKELVSMPKLKHIGIEWPSKSLVKDFDKHGIKVLSALTYLYKDLYECK